MRWVLPGPWALGALLVGGLLVSAGLRDGSRPGDAGPGARPSSIGVLRSKPSPTGRVLHVSAGADAGGNGSKARPFASINAALAEAKAGDTVAVGKGTYRSPVTTVRAGKPGKPIRIVGSGARITGDGEGRLVQILHSHVTLESFDLSKGNILVWVFHAKGARILGNNLHDASGECIRLKYFARANEVAGNRIDGCGREGFDLSDDDKNGEGIYIGTAPEQLDRNPTDEPDASNDNWIHDNEISVPAECVDVKEAATGNRVEHNTCTGGKDPDGAGFSSRGRATVFVANVSSGHAGAGIRLGGDEETDGLLNTVVGNHLTDSRGYGLKIMRHPQGLICGNDIHGNQAGLTNSDDVVIARCRPGQLSEILSARRTL